MCEWCPPIVLQHPSAFLEKLWCKAAVGYEGLEHSVKACYKRSLRKALCFKVGYLGPRKFEFRKAEPLNGEFNIEVFPKTLLDHRKAFRVVQVIPDGPVKEFHSLL